jgi:diguanylate cyclase (GGDEF)-like protein
MVEKKPTVLIVDDVPVNLALMSAILENDCRTICTSDSAEVAPLAQEHQPDLILLDIMMPGLNGFDVCGLLKADLNTRHIPIIFLTSLTEEEDEERGLGLGAIDYITKPFSVPVVRARVRNHLELQRQRSLLERLSSIDGLTGISNRRALDAALQREWLRAQRHESPLSLLMIDVDLFKQFNDGYGHIAGDECLKAVARTVADHAGRTSDLVARYGGEEFACILPDTCRGGAMRVAENIRTAVLDLRIPHAYSSVASHVTVSIGGATARPNNRIDPAELVRRADAQLYDSKNNGRNRMSFCTVEG